jgi:hypothetical protein
MCKECAVGWTFIAIGVLIGILTYVSKRRVGA